MDQARRRPFRSRGIGDRDPQSARSALIAACYRAVAGVLKAGALFLDYDLFFDRSGGLPQHLQLMKEAGFARTDCLWQQAPHATVAAYR